MGQYYETSQLASVNELATYHDGYLHGEVNPLLDVLGLAVELLAKQADVHSSLTGAWLESSTAKR